MWKYQVLKNIECLNKKKKYFNMKTPKGPGLKILWNSWFVVFDYLQFRYFPIIIGRQLYWYEHVVIIEFVVLKSVSHAVCFFYQYNYVEAFLPTELQLQLRICVYFSYSHLLQLKWLRKYLPFVLLIPNKLQIIFEFLLCEHDINGASIPMR